MRKCSLLQVVGALPDWHGSLRDVALLGPRIDALRAQVKLIAPQFVKPYVKSGKNDANDAEAICEAVGRPSMRFVAIKTVDQQVMQAEHRSAADWYAPARRWAMRYAACLGEFGIVVPRARQLRAALPVIQEDQEKRPDSTTSRLLRSWPKSCGRLMTGYGARQAIQAAARADERVRRLLAIEGIGPISASALVAAVGDASNLPVAGIWQPGSDSCRASIPVAAKQRLGRISKRGDTYLRTLLIHGARAALNASGNKEDARSRWAQALGREAQPQHGHRRAGEQERAGLPGRC